MGRSAPLPVSAVIAAYNREHTVERAIASIRRQSLQPAEIIVVDDASTDRTAAVAQAAGATVIRRTQNGGAASARNDGLAAAREPWIALLDSDDEWLPDHLATLWPHTATHALVTGGSVVVEDTTGAETRHAAVRRRTRLDSPMRLVFPDNVISSGGVLVSTEVLREIGGFDTSLRYSEDLDLWVRVLARHRGLALPDPVCRYHVHEGQKTSRLDDARRAQRHLLERYRDQEWWSEPVYRRRLALNECERRILAGAKLSAVAHILAGSIREPRTFVPAALVLVARSLSRPAPRTRRRQRSTR